MFCDLPVGLLPTYQVLGRGWENQVLTEGSGPNISSPFEF